MFERSKSGQQNRSKLIGYDYICYVEGGGTSEGTQAYDVTFWGTIFRTFCPTIKIKFVPRGGKPSLQALAHDLIVKDISNVIVAMDADYDHITTEVISDRRVFYTHGYSWENDAFAVENIPNIYKALCHCASIPAEAEQQINSHHARLLKELRWPAQADHIALRSGTSVLPRQAPGRVIKLPAGTNSPSVDRGEVRRLIRAAKQSAKLKRATFRLKDVSRFCVGHVYELAMIYLVKMVAKVFGGKSNISPDHVRDVCLQTLPDFMGGGLGAIFLHHKTQCSGI